MNKIGISAFLSHCVFLSTLANIANVDRLRIPDLPLRFERYESEGSARFVGRGAGLTVFLERESIRVVLPRSIQGPAVILTMRLLGEGCLEEPLGERVLPYRTNYLLRGESSLWLRDLTSFSRVRYQQVYPGIDLVFHASAQLVEFDFEVSPGADPNKIQLGFDGANEVDIGRAGSLILAARDRKLVIKAPQAFQDIGADRVKVESRYELSKDSPERIRLALGEYNREIPLTIDPALLYSSYLGGAQDDQILDVGTDASGNFYLLGETSSANLPTGSVFQGEKNAGQDLFVARLAAADRSLNWITYIGGSAADRAGGLEVDSDGNLVIVGTTESTDFPTVRPVQENAAGGGSDAFLLKLRSSGSALIYSTYLGGGRGDSGAAVALSPSRGVYVVGSTRSMTFLPPGVELNKDSFKDTLAGGADGFVIRLTQDGQNIRSFTYIGGRSDDDPRGIALLSNGEVVVAGLTRSNDFPLENALQANLSGPSDGFIATIAPGLDALSFSTYFGSGRNDAFNAVALGSDDLVVLAGETDGFNLRTKDPVQGANGGGLDMMIVGIAGGTGELAFSSYLGGSSLDTVRDLLVEADKRVVIAGATVSADFPLVGTTSLEKGGADTVLAVLDFHRAELVFSTLVGATGGEIAEGLVRGARAGEYFLAGITDSNNLPVVDGIQSSLGGPGIYQSSTASLFWKATGTGLDDPDVESLCLNAINSWAYAGTSSSGVYLSKDVGQTWTSIGPEGRRILSIASHPTDVNVLYAGTSIGLERTSDGGQSWETLSDGERLPFTAFSALVFDPSNSEIIYAATSTAGVFKSEDGGETWRAKNGGLDDAGKQVFRVLIDPSNTEVLYLGSNGAVYKTVNGGTTWDRTSFTGVGPVRGLAMDPRDSSIVYASGRLSIFGNFVATTADGGLNWTTPQDPVQGQVTDLVVNPSNPAQILASTLRAGIIRSTDRARTWSQKNDGLGTLDLLDIEVDSRNSNRLYTAYLAGSDGFFLGLQTDNTFYFPQVADGIDGRIQFQTALVFVNTGADTTVVVDFFDSKGDPMAIQLGAGGPASRHSIELARGQAFFAQSPGEEAGFRVGYARVTAGAGVDGTAIFVRTDVVARDVLYEAGVPSTRASGRFVFLLDSLEDKDTGIALVNASQGNSSETESTEVTLTLRDADRFLIDTITLQLGPGEHLARFVFQLFPNVREQASEMQGIVEVEAEFPLVAVTLRERDNPDLELPLEVASLTPFPVMSPLSLSSTLYFPQVANGIFGLTADQFRTTFILANPGLSVASVALEFFDLDGNPMVLDLGTGNPVSGRQIFLLPGGFEFLQTSGEGNPQIGYARVQSSSLSVGGTAVFTQRTTIQNKTLFEAGVAATIPRRHFSIFLDSLGSRDTGLALVNASQETADITLRLYNLENQLIAETTLSMEAGQHLPRFVFQLFPDVPEAAEMQGVLTLSSTQPIAAVTLRQKNVAGVGFPFEIPTLTTFPVISGIADGEGE